MIFNIALIMFRESLEAALVIGIVAAATRTLPGRTVGLALGALIGVAGSVLVAAGAGTLQSWAGGMGQEVFNAIVLTLALAMLSWHNIWMASHGRQMARHAHSLGDAVARGELALTAVSAAIALTVLREGSEAVLFVYGMAAGASLTLSGLAAGVGLGLGAGALAGTLIYRGLMRIPVRHFFTVTSWLVLLLAAGMAGQLARNLIQADLLPPLASPLWDSSRLVPPASAAGTLLHALVGYDAQPSAMQVLFYVTALAGILFAMRRVRAVPA